MQRSQLRKRNPGLLFLVDMHTNTSTSTIMQARGCQLLSTRLVVVVVVVARLSVSHGALVLTVPIIATYLSN